MFVSVIVAYDFYGFVLNEIIHDRIILDGPQRFFVNPVLNIFSVTPFR